MPRRKGRRRRRRGNGGSYGANRLRVAGMGAAYGYLKAKTGILEKAPFVEAVGRDATNAVVLHYAAKHFRSKWLDAMATAVAGHVGVNLGRAGMDVAEFAQMSGDDDIAGVLEP